MPPSLALLSEHPTLGETIGYQINGLIVVATALGLIWGMLELTGRYFRRRASLAPSPPASPVAPNAPSPAAAPLAVTANADSDHLAVVIAAAVHTILGSSARVVSITPNPDHQNWSFEGRRHHFASHKVR